MRVYLDTCCLSRPWDDQSQVKVHLEAEAVLFLVSEARQGRLELTSSAYLLEEIARIPEPKRREDVVALLDPAAVHLPACDTIFQRSKAFAAHNIRNYDALHIAAAEAARCNYFFTTDDRLLKRAQRAGSLLNVKILNPADWPPEADFP